MRYCEILMDVMDVNVLLTEKSQEITDFSRLLCKRSIPWKPREDSCVSDFFAFRYFWQVINGFIWRSDIFLLTFLSTCL